MTPDAEVTVDARPQPLSLDLSRSAVVVVDMLNDFGAEGGMFDRAGVDISGIRGVIEPTARVLSATRRVDVPIIYLCHAYRPDLSDLGSAGSKNRRLHIDGFSVGDEVTAPDGSPSRILVQDTWNTAVIDELAPEPGDIEIRKTRFSGFYETELDAILTERGVDNLVFTGCTTSVCVESTVRDAMFRDYAPLVLEDCTAEPIGEEFPRSNHEASLLLMEQIFGWVATSTSFVSALNEVELSRR